jgi:hypothetical protein
MSHQRSFLTVENSLYLALFLVALALRLGGLGAHPLTDAEAREALAAFRGLYGGAETILPHSPAHFFFTYLGYLVFDASDATARLAPALFGAGLVLIPALFREHLGRASALAVSVLLALSSGLLTAARTADGAMIALFGLGLGLGALRRYTATSHSAWLVTSAVGFGVGLASGGAFLAGASILALTTLAMAWVKPEARDALREIRAKVRAQAPVFLVALGVTVTLVATVGLVHPRGLSALANSWTAWLRGFLPSAAGRPPLFVPTLLLIYEPLLVVFGVAGMVRAFRSAQRGGLWLFWLSLIALAYAVLYSGRTPLDVIWVATPLAALAGVALVEIVTGAWVREEWPYVAVQTGVSVALLAFSGIMLTSFSEQVRFNPTLASSSITVLGHTYQASPIVFLYLAVGAALLVPAVALLLGLGWSPRSAQLGLTLGAAAALLSVNVGAGWGLTQSRANSPVELWWDRPTADALHLLTETLSSVSNYAVGDERDIEVTVLASTDSVLAWTLRDYAHASFVEALDPLVASPVVVAPADQENPTLGSAYVGQDFALHQSASGALSWQEQVAWLVFRRRPVESERIILWVRQDVAQLPDAGPGQ